MTSTSLDFREIVQKVADLVGGESPTVRGYRGDGKPLTYVDASPEKMIQALWTLGLLNVNKVEGVKIAV